MNKLLARGGALLLLMNPFVDKLSAQEEDVKKDQPVRLISLSQEELDMLHQSQAQSFSFDSKNRFSYLEQGTVFVPDFYPKPNGFTLSGDVWKSLSASLSSSTEFNSQEKLNEAVNDLKEKNIRLEFKVHPRLMAFLIANNHISQKDIDANKEDLFFLLSQENHLLKKTFPSGNAVAHDQNLSSIGNPVTTPKHVYDTRKRISADSIRKFIDDFYRDSAEKTRLQAVLKTLGFEDYNGFSPMTFMQMAKDYDLVHHPEKFNKLISQLNLDPDKPLKVNFSINILADESADHNACFYSSMINPEKAWESAMKYSAKPLLQKDGSITMVLGVRENKEDLSKLLARLKEFFDQVNIDKTNLQINMMAHGSFDETTKTGAVHLSEKDDDDNKTLSDKDRALYKEIGSVFAGTDKCHINFMSCFSGKYIARVIAQEILDGLHGDDSLKEFSFSAPYEAGVFSSAVSQEGLTQYDSNGVSSFRYKNYFPRLGTVEYKKNFDGNPRIVVK